MKPLNFVSFLVGLLLPFFFVGISQAETWTINTGLYASALSANCGTGLYWNGTHNAGIQGSSGPGNTMAPEYCLDGVWYTQNMTTAGWNSDYTIYYKAEVLGTKVYIYHSNDYVPPPTEPEYCSNHEWDVDLEDGYDCGGECLSDCMVGCPTGSDYVEIPFTDSDLSFSACFYPSNTAPGTEDNCPKYYLWNSETSACTSWAPAVTGSEDYLSSISSDDPNPLFEVSFTPYNSVSVTTETTDNPDGTQTIVETTTTATPNDDGTTSNTQEVKTSVYDPATDTYTSSSIAVTNWIGTDGTTLPDSDSDGVPDGLDRDVDGDGIYNEDDPDADGDGVYDGEGLGLDGVGLESGSRYNSVSAVNFDPLYNSVSGIMNRSPFSVLTRVQTIYNTWIVEPQTPSFEVDFLPLQTEPVYMDLSLLDPLAGFVRSCLALLSALGGAYAAIRPWRG